MCFFSYFQRHTDFPLQSNKKLFMSNNRLKYSRGAYSRHICLHVSMSNISLHVDIYVNIYLCAYCHVELGWAHLTRYLCLSYSFLQKQVPFHRLPGKDLLGN